MPLCEQRRLVQGFTAIVLDACLLLHCALYSKLLKMSSAVCCYQHDSHGCGVILRRVGGEGGGRSVGETGQRQRVPLSLNASSLERGRRKDDSCKGTEVKNKTRGVPD